MTKCGPAPSTGTAAEYVVIQPPQDGRAGGCSSISACMYSMELKL